MFEAGSFVWGSAEESRLAGQGSFCLMAHPSIARITSFVPGQTFTWILVEQRKAVMCESGALGTETCPQPMLIDDCGKVASCLDT